MKQKQVVVDDGMLAHLLYHFLQRNNARIHVCDEYLLLDCNDFVSAYALRAAA
jgi:hypothetical protein